MRAQGRYSLISVKQTIALTGVSLVRSNLPFLVPMMRLLSFRLTAVAHRFWLATFSEVVDPGLFRPA